MEYKELYFDTFRIKTINNIIQNALDIPYGSNVFILYGEKSEFIYKLSEADTAMYRVNESI